MKRYWKIISICLVTLLVIGTFYIQSSFATNESVEIEFEKVSGNEDELENIMLSGNYSIGYMYHPVQITSEETVNPIDLPFLRKLDRLTVPPNFEGLVKQHKNFMRSKDLVHYHFFENENLLAYARIQSKNNIHPLTELTFDIEVLNKKSEEITSFQLNVPEREEYGWMNVEDVQIIDGELKVMTRGSRIKDTQGSRINNENELRVYTFDMKEKKLRTDETIISIPAVENGWSDVRIVNNNSIHRSKYLLIKIEAFENEMDRSDGGISTIINEFMVYDIENNQSINLVGPEETLNSINDSSAIINSTVYIPSQSADGFKVHRYNIEKEEWAEKLTFNGFDAKEGEIPDFQVMNGKMYAIHSTNNENILFIGDIETGESLYVGKLKVKNQSRDQKDFPLYIYDIEYVQ